MQDLCDRWRNCFFIFNHHHHRRLLLPRRGILTNDEIAILQLRQLQSLLPFWLDFSPSSTPSGSTTCQKIERRMVSLNMYFGETTTALSPPQTNELKKRACALKKDLRDTHTSRDSGKPPSQNVVDNLGKQKMPNLEKRNLPPCLSLSLSLSLLVS